MFIIIVFYDYLLLDPCCFCANQWTPCIKDLGFCFGTNGHPGRDTDVASRLPKSRIEDLSFYIGFTMELHASRILSRVLARMGILQGIRT